MNQKTLIITIITVFILLGCQNESIKQERPNQNEQTEKVKINPLKELEQVDKLLSEITEKPQRLTAPSDRETTISGAKGTVIHVDPNRIESVDGSPLGDSIKIELLEMTRNSSMILNNVQTVSNGQILVTGGAYYLNMTSDGKQLKIKKGKGLNVEFPQLTEDEMGLFLGERDSLGQINWSKTNKKFESKEISDSLILKSNLVDIPDTTDFKKPTKPLKLNNQDNRVLKLALEDTLLEPELQQFNNVKFRVNDDSEYDPNDADNTWYKVSISKSEVEGEYILTFMGVTQEGKKIIKEYEVTPALEGVDYKSALKLYDKKYEEYLKQKIKREEEIQKMIEEAKKRQAENELKYETYAAIELMDFGWINCDRFLNDPGPYKNIDIIVNNDSLSGARIYAVFNDIKSIMTADYYKGQNTKIAFNDLPANRNVSIIALAAQNGIPYIFETKINTIKNQKVEVNFIASTQEEIKKKINRLN